MKFQDLTKNYPVALGSAIGILIFGGFAIWRSAGFDDLKSVLATREQESERLASNVRNAAKLTAQVEQLSGMTETIQKRLTSPNDLAGNQQYFYKFESDNKVKLSDLKQSTTPRAAKKKSYTIYSTVSYSLKAQGDYAHLLQFLRSIESGSRIAVVEGASFDLGSQTKKDDEIGDNTPLTLSLNLQFLAPL